MSDNGFTIERIRADRILHEALTAGPDPLHLSLVFGISHNTALRYTTAAAAARLRPHEPAAIMDLQSPKAVGSP